MKTSGQKFSIWDRIASGSGAGGFFTKVNAMPSYRPIGSNAVGCSSRDDTMPLFIFFCCVHRSSDLQCFSMDRTTPTIAPSTWGIWTPYNKWSLGLTESSNRHLDRFSRFCRAHGRILDTCLRLSGVLRVIYRPMDAYAARITAPVQPWLVSGREYERDRSVQGAYGVDTGLRVSNRQACSRPSVVIPCCVHLQMTAIRAV